MSNSLLPITSLFLSFMTAVLVIDLRHDYCSDFTLTQSYYIGVSKAPLVFHLIIPTVILILAISLIVNIFRYFKLYDIITLIINIPCLYIFINILIPNQNLLTQTNINDSYIITYIEVNRLWHLVLLGINVISVIFQILARSPDGKVKTS